MHELFIDHKNGEFEQLCVKLKKYPEKFYNYFLCSIQTFDYILKEIIEHVIKYSMFHDVISPKERLAITLRYLSTGMSFWALNHSFRVSDCSVGKIWLKYAMYYIKDSKKNI